jgi:PAS domain S-box-containing protein
VQNIAMQESDLLRLAVDRSPDALVLCAPDDRILFWGLAAEMIFGHTPAEATGKRWCDLVVPPEHQADELQTRERCVNQDSAVVRAAVRRHRDGRLFYADGATRAVRHADGTLHCYVLSMRDVTALTVADDARLLEERYRDLLEWVPDAIVIANEIGRIVLFNSQSEAMFGGPRTAMLGQPIESLLPHRYGRAHVGHRWRYANNPQVRRMGAGLELFGLRRDGTEFPVEISLSPLAADGRRFMVSAIRDISLQKKAEQELQEKNAALLVANQAKDRFLATMSHELRTPLNAILGFTGILLMRLPGGLNAEQERQLGIVKQSGEHLLALINDLLDLAKIQSGAYVLSPELLDLGGVLAGIHSTIQPLADKKNLILALHVPEVPVRRAVDPRALKQVLLNLANNAIKFTAAGTVSLQLEQRPGGAVAISVGDTGVGIDESDLGKLFGSFTQVGDPRRRPEGTGLGLHLSARLAELMGGRIEVQSVVGVGSRFTLILEGS